MVVPRRGGRGRRILHRIMRTLSITAIRRKDILLDLIRSQCQYQRCQYKRQLRRPHSWRAITLCASQVGDLKNLDLLDSGATDTFTNLRPMREETFTVTVERIISNGRGGIMKKFCLSGITFKDVLYIPILVNNLYSVTRLRRRGWDINMKLSSETTFTVNQKNHWLWGRRSRRVCYMFYGSYAEATCYMHWQIPQRIP